MFLTHAVERLNRLSELPIHVITANDDSRADQLEHILARVVIKQINEQPTVRAVMSYTK